MCKKIIALLLSLLLLCLTAVSFASAAALTLPALRAEPSAAAGVRAEIR